MLTSSNNGTNPGVGLKLTAPRNQAHDVVHKAQEENPGPGTYQIRGSTDLTDRERIQNEITSKRYGNPGSTNGSGASMMQQTPKASSFPSSSPSPCSSGQKRQRVDQDLPSEYYNIPGMGNQSDRQLHQNGITSKRYHSASGDTHHSK